MRVDEGGLLVTLSDSGRMLADPDDDLRGLEVTDPRGTALGKVKDLIVDPDQGRVRLLWVERGGVLGVGATPMFIPVSAVVGVDNDVVRVGEPQSVTARESGYDPQLVDINELHRQLRRQFG